MFATRAGVPKTVVALWTGGDERPARRGLLASLLLAVALLLWASPAGAVPPGFSDTLIAPVKVSEIAWTPDGRMLLGTKEGQIRVYTGGALLPTPALDLSSVMCTNQERGLQGVAVHPNFSVNHFIYVYYNYAKFGPCLPTGDSVNRLSRFVLSDANTIDPASEVVLYESQPASNGIHNGGNLAFAKDGLLYVTTGEGGSSSLSPFARDPGHLLGKVLRLTDTGGIPADNPFTGPDSARCNMGGVPPAGSPPGTKCQEVFAMGLRNPFRAAFDPNAAGVQFDIDDVGNHTWEEIDQGQALADYGWPIREGPCARDSDTDCGPPPAGVTNPIYWYHHVAPDGGAITGAAFVPDGVWPSQWDDVYLFAEYVFGKIEQLVPLPGGGFTAIDFTPATLVTTLRFGPDGALYYASRDLGGQVRRISYTGSADRSPTAVVTAAPTAGPLPLDVQFDGSASSDPDGDALMYSWDFGDGSPPEAVPGPMHSYTTAGTFTARLTVSDGRGGSDSATVRVDPGDTAPVPTIDAPAEGALFAVGDPFTLHGHAADAEDGALPDSALSWEVLRHHANHTHPFLEPISGNDIPIVAPEPEDLDAARTSYLEIRLTATDSRGVTTTVTRDLRPRLVSLTFATDPPGLELNAGGLIVKSPATLPSWERFAFPVEVRDQADASGTPFQFASWSDGGEASHTIVTPATPATFTATFKGGAPPTSTPVTPSPQPRLPTLGISGLRAFPGHFFAHQRLSCSRGAAPARRCHTIPTPVGTRLRFVISAPAKVTILLIRPASRVCAGPSTARRCRTVRARLIDRLAVRRKAGANAVHLPGRVHGRALSPGPYQLRVQARSETAQSRVAYLRIVVREG